MFGRAALKHSRISIQVLVGDEHLHGMTDTHGEVVKEVSKYCMLCKVFKFGPFIPVHSHKPEYEGNQVSAFLNKEFSYNLHQYTL